MTAIVLSLFDYTGVMVQPWVNAGYECWIADIRHPAGIVKDGNLVRAGVDIAKWLPPRRDYKIVFGFPPCTNLAASGARWFKDKGLAGLAEGIMLVERARDIAEWSEAPWMIENPSGTLSSYWRKPDSVFDPYQFSAYSDETDNYTKKTCLWVGNGFRIPKKRRVSGVPDTNKIIGVTTTKSRRQFARSVTPAGFAQAVFEANLA